jgi:hypothetical protein
MDRDTFLATALRNPHNQTIVDELLRLAVPDAWIVAGCLVQTVWNVLTGRTAGYGINDYDVFYFDPDFSWEAEDAMIRQLQHRLAHLGVTVGGAQPGARASLVSTEARFALSTAASFDRRYRPLSDQEYAFWNSPHERRS